MFAHRHTLRAAEPGCRPHEFVEVSARLINTLYAFVHSADEHQSAETEFLRLADTDKLLLLSHSLGGSVAFSVLTGRELLPLEEDMLLRYALVRIQDHGIMKTAELISMGMTDVASYCCGTVFRRLTGLTG